MIKWVKTRFWSTVASLILRNRVFCILLIVATTVFFGLQWKNIRFVFNEASLLPDKHPFNQNTSPLSIVLEMKATSLFWQFKTLLCSDPIRFNNGARSPCLKNDTVAAVTGIGNLKQPGKTNNKALWWKMSLINWLVTNRSGQT